MVGLMKKIFTSIGWFFTEISLTLDPEKETGIKYFFANIFYEIGIYFYKIGK